MKLRKVFDPTKRPWVNMNGGSTQDIISICDQCPTDALTWKWNKDLSAAEEAELHANPPAEEMVPAPVAEITLINNGPAIVKGKFRILNQMGEKIETAAQVALCRCGRSKNLPFCDGSHRS
jgi:hypothetical protein